MLIVGTYVVCSGHVVPLEPATRVGTKKIVRLCLSFVSVLRCRSTCGESVIINMCYESYYVELYNTIKSVHFYKSCTRVPVQQ